MLRQEACLQHAKLQNPLNLSVSLCTVLLSTASPSFAQAHRCTYLKPSQTSHARPRCSFSACARSSFNAASALTPQRELSISLGRLHDACFRHASSSPSHTSATHSQTRTQSRSRAHAVRRDPMLEQPVLDAVHLVLVREDPELSWIRLGRQLVGDEPRSPYAQSTDLLVWFYHHQLL